MFVFGTAIGCLYNEYVKGKIIHIGSLINNAVLQTDGVSSRSVVFISQFRKKPNDDKFIINSEGQGLSWEQYHAAEAIVLNFLQKWCARNKKILRIAGISYEQQCPERAFYESLLEGVQWEYVPRSDRYSSYRLVDSAEIVVFIDSTLGYEAFVRGKRVACFCCRGAFVDLKDRGFGWPAILPECGPFWTNEADEAVFQQIIEYLYVVSDKDWEITQKRYTSELMEYDPGNSIFSKILETELIPSPDSFPISA
jgi:surface carbohydrate biosynthesis protein